MAAVLDPSKEVIDKAPVTQSYQSFLSLFPNLASSGLTEEFPTPIPMMFEKGAKIIEIDEGGDQDEIIAENLQTELPLIQPEGEKVQEVTLGPGKTAFSLDNQDSKLLVDNFVVEETSDYSYDSHLPHTTMYPLQSYTPTSTAKITEITDEDEKKYEKPLSEPKESEIVKEWDRGLVKTADTHKYKMKPKQNVNNNLVVLSIEEEEQSSEDEGESTVAAPSVPSATQNVTSSSSTSSSAEFVEVEKFSIDEDFDYDNIVLARKYSPETERRLNGKWKGFEDELSKLNVND